MRWWGWDGGCRLDQSHDRPLSADRLTRHTEVLLASGLAWRLRTEAEPTANHGAETSGRFRTHFSPRVTVRPFKA